MHRKLPCLATDRFVMLMVHPASGPGESHKNEIASLNVPDQDSLTEVARSISNQERTFAHRAVKANFMRDVWVLLPGGFFLAAASCAGVRGLGGSLPTALSRVRLQPNRDETQLKVPRGANRTLGSSSLEARRTR